MRVKTVPPAPERCDVVFDARGAVPIVPKPEGDCCARLIERIDLPSRDLARTWLTFLRGLGLARQTDRGFVRTHDDVAEDELADRFLDGVFGAREVVAILEAADRHLSVDAVFDRFERHIPEWERHKQPASWRTIWQERVADLLDWLVLFELVERVDDSYAPI